MTETETSRRTLLIGAALAAIAGAAAFSTPATARSTVRMVRHRHQDGLAAMAGRMSLASSSGED